jgi:predicted acylesterase/phospholipase RssA
MIEHLVISSGGPHIIVQFGMILEAIQTNIFSLSTIKSIHGCSSGAIIGTFLCLRIPIEDIIEYVITRKWEKCIVYDIQNFYTTKGIIDNGCIAEMLIPFFNAYDVPLTTTMKEFYERTEIDFDILVTEVSEMKSVLINHTTFPDLPVLTAIRMSGSVPIVFPPVKYMDKYYIDGVCRRHCPMVDFPEETVCIFSIDTSLHLTPNFDDVTDYFQFILMKSYRVLTESESIPKGLHFSCVDIPSVMDANVWKSVIQEESCRRRMIEVGRAVLQKIESVPSPIDE